MKAEGREGPAENLAAQLRRVRWSQGEAAPGLRLEMLEGCPAHSLGPRGWVRASLRGSPKIPSDLSPLQGREKTVASTGAGNS